MAMATTFRRGRLKWMAVAANNHLHPGPGPAEKDNVFSQQMITKLYQIKIIKGNGGGKSSQRFPISNHHGYFWTVSWSQSLQAWNWMGSMSRRLTSSLGGLRPFPGFWQGMHHAWPQLDKPVLALPSSAHRPCHGLPEEC